MSRKKILWLCSWYPNKMQPFNGDFIQRHAVAAALFNDIYVIHVTAHLSEENKREEKIEMKQGLTEHIIYYRKSMSLFSRIINHFRRTTAYKNAVKKYLVLNRKPDLVHVHVPVSAGLIALWIKRVFKVSYVVTEHWTIYQPQNLIKFHQRSLLFKWALRQIISKSTMLLPVSDDLGRLVNKLVSKKDYSIIENAANENLFFYDKKENTSSFRFIHVSNMGYQKNVEDIIICFCIAIERGLDAELTIVGSVPPSVKDMLEATKLIGKKIFLKGEISYQEVAIEMRKAESLLMFSRYENSPCSIIEALCCGLPVITTNVGGIPEIINETNGILVASPDKDALINAIEKMVENFSIFDREKISREALSRFSYKVIGKKLNEIYAVASK